MAAMIALAGALAVGFDGPSPSGALARFLLSVFDFRPDWHSAALLAIVALLALLRFRLLKGAFFRDRPLVGYVLAGGLAVLAVIVMMHQGV